MSLIDEALKRARQEAARQDAAEREARYARVPVYAPLVTSRRSSRSWLIPVMVALCIAVGVGVGVLLTRGPGAERAAVLTPDPSPIALPPSGRGAPPPAPKTSSPPLPEGGRAMGERGQGGEDSEPQTPRIEVVEETPAPARPVPAPAPVQEAPPAAVPATPDPLPYPNVPAAPREEPAAPAIQLPQTPPSEPKTYVREVPVSGGGSIRLNGIAYSEQPVALFSDKVVGVGESIGGYTVVAIEQKRVQLQGQGQTVYVTLQ
ncbi:MAG TPA: hypothetical protein VF756_18565 [Thermoanaerobaculia bacterium]